MHLNVDDDGFVRAPVGLTYRRLTDLSAWPTWWPGCSVEPLGDDRYRFQLRPGRARRPITLEVSAGKWRHDAGFELRLTGDLEGRAEFWLEEGWGGTVVHHLLDADDRTGSPLRTHRRYRAALRRGLWGLKDQLHIEVREALGLAP